MKRLALAIARDHPAPPDLDGIERFASRGLAILHQTAPADALEPSLATLQAYAATIAELHAGETILPLRFGSVHDTPSRLEDWLRVHADSWREALDEIEGCHEMGLRVLLDPPAETPVVAKLFAGDCPGTSYLKALKARLDVSNAARAEAMRLAGRLGEELDQLARRWLVEDPVPGREPLLSLMYLIPRPSLGLFRETVKRLQSRIPGKLLLTGPWPPYSFTDAGKTPSKSNIVSNLHHLITRSD
jgi:hypothetical protein